MSERKRMPPQTREAFTFLYAFGCGFEHAKGEIERLVRRVPNGWRDARLVQAKLDKLTENLMDTIPLEQLGTIRHQMEISEIRVMTRDVGKRTDANWVISRQDLADLAGFAIETTCILCDGNNKQCRLRKIIKDLPLGGFDGFYVPCMKWRKKQ